MAHSQPPRKRGYSASRVVFAIAYLGIQAVLIATAGARPDHAFGFRMFSESSVVRFALMREIDAPSGHNTLLVPTWHGRWTAATADGERHSFDWQDRVMTPSLATFDIPFEASYGSAALLTRMQAALDDVATHLDGDVETRRLVVEATVRRNGREPSAVRLVSVARQPPRAR